MARSDQKLLDATDYQVIDKAELKLSDAKRLSELYHHLNIDKYSKINPQLNQHLFEHALRSDFMQFKALKKDNRIDGILGYYRIGNVITSPIFGYDTTMTQDSGLYRMIAHLLLLEAKREGVILHQSAGAGSFKKLRRAKPALEYYAVYDNHLPLRKRAATKLIDSVFSMAGDKTIDLMDR